MADVVALGELLVDFVCKETDEIGYPTLVGKPGGAPGNYLAAVKKYGGSCAMSARTPLAVCCARPLRTPAST